MRYIWFNRKRGRRARASDAAVHAVPAALPASSMAKMATMALSATAKHVILMATSVVADITLASGFDQAVNALPWPCPPRGSMPLQCPPHTSHIPPLWPANHDFMRHYVFMCFAPSFLRSPAACMTQIS